MDNTQAIEERITKNKAALIEQFKKMPVLQVALARESIGRSTYYRWRENDPAFRKEADDAIAEGELLTTEMSESQLITLIQDKHFQAIKLWLRSHHPKYAEKLEILGRMTHEMREPTEEENKLLEDALLAALPKNKQQTPYDGTT